MKWVAPIVLLLLPVTAAATQDDEKEVRRLVAQLAANDPNERDDATGKLIAMGEGIIPILKKLDPKDREARSRLNRVLEALELPRQWADDLLELQPHMAISKIQMAIQQNEITKVEASRILAVTLLDKECTDDMQRMLMSTATSLRLKGLWRPLVKRAEKGNRWDSYTVRYLQNVRLPKEAAGHLLAALPKMRDRNMLMQVIEIVARLDTDPEAIADAVDKVFHEKADDVMVTNMLSYISQGRIKAPLRTMLRLWDEQSYLRQSYLRNAILKSQPDKSVDRMYTMLDSTAQDEVLLAIEYIGKHRLTDGLAPMIQRFNKSDAREYNYRPRIIQNLKALRPAKKLKEWLASGGPPPRLAVIPVVVALGLADLGPDVAACLDDEDPEVRAAAASALSGMKYGEAVVKLMKMIDDKSPTVRAAALRSVAMIQGKKATALMMKHLLADDPDMQAAAVEHLPQMDLDVVIETLTSDENLDRYIVRYAIATMMAHGDKATMNRIMARVGDRLSTEELNAMIRLIELVRK